MNRKRPHFFGAQAHMSPGSRHLVTRTIFRSDALYLMKMNIVFESVDLSGDEYKWSHLDSPSKAQLSYRSSHFSYIPPRYIIGPFL